jgi:hypothetical protein
MPRCAIEPAGTSKMNASPTNTSAKANLAGLDG